MTGLAHRQIAVVETLLAGGCHTTGAISETTGLPRNEVADTCCRLITRGYIVRRARGCFEMSEDGLKAHAAGVVLTSGARGARRLNTPIRPRRETDRDRIWRAIRLQRKFSVASIAEVTGASVEHVGRFVRLLGHAGYLVELAKEPGFAMTSNGFKRWALVDDTGFRAPALVRRDGGRRVFDRNTGIERPWR